MPRQNRVNPIGDLLAVSAKGAFMGNRGVLHDDQGQLTQKRWTHQQWIICKTEFKGRKRPLMSPGCYTELFFFDEATALAAGHRPCWECRRDDFKRFKAAWLKGNPQYGFADNVKIGEIDKILQQERVTRAKEKVTYQSTLGNIPDGVMVSLTDDPDASWLLWKGQLHLWSHSGYRMLKEYDLTLSVDVLTPKSTVVAITNGYVPIVNI